MREAWVGKMKSSCLGFSLFIIFSLHLHSPSLLWWENVYKQYLPALSFCFHYTFFLLLMTLLSKLSLNSWWTRKAVIDPSSQPLAHRFLAVIVRLIIYYRGIHLTPPKTTQRLVVKGFANLGGVRWLLDLTPCPAMNCGTSSWVKWIPQIVNIAQMFLNRNSCS